MVERARADEHLFQMCEHYDILDKIVLHDDPSGWRLRLHVFSDDYFDRPHNHRWWYSSLILSGGYRHFLYRCNAPEATQPTVDDLELIMVRSEMKGSSYTVSDEMVHSLAGSPGTMTLMIRGPSIKDRFFVVDKETGETLTQYGAGQDRSRICSLGG